MMRLSPRRRLVAALTVLRAFVVLVPVRFATSAPDAPVCMMAFT
jgi:hypothetical protein